MVKLIQNAAVDLWGKPFPEGEAALIAKRTAGLPTEILGQALEALKSEEEIRRLPTVRQVVARCHSLRRATESVCGACHGETGRAFWFFPMRPEDAAKRGLISQDGAWVQTTRNDGFVRPEIAHEIGWPRYSLFVWCPRCRTERPNLRDLEGGGKLFGYADGPSKATAKKPVEVP